MKRVVAPLMIACMMQTSTFAFATVHGPNVPHLFGAGPNPNAPAPSAGATKGAAPGTAGSAASADGGDLVVKAQSLFDDQRYEDSIQVLSAALVRPGSTKTQKVEIYRLLSLNYITLNRKEESESAVRGLLSIQPDYQLPVTESPRFRDFFTAVRAKWEGEGRPGLVKDDPNVPKIAIKHGSPTEANPNSVIDIVARLDDPNNRVNEVHVRYRTGSHGDFEDLVCEYTDGRAHAQIPGAAVKPPIVEYYIEALDKTGAAIGTRGDSSTPIRVAVQEPQRGGWVLPVAIGGGVIATGAIVLGALALGGAFKSNPSNNNNNPNKNPAAVSTVSVSISSFR